MPELPEVETTAKTLNRLIHGLTIRDIWTDYNSPFYHKKEDIKNPSYFVDFKKKTTGKKITGVGRRAKNILIEISGGRTILIHMKMTGHLLYGEYKNKKIDNKKTWKPAEAGPLNDPFNRFIHLVFSLSNKKHLVLSDMRKFAKIKLIESGKISKSDDLKNLGPEPLDKKFNFRLFKERILRKQNCKIKTALMDQSLISGIGNIYSDEALWLSGIHPSAQTGKIEEKNLKILNKKIIFVLKKGIRFGGDSMSDYRTPSGEPGKFQLHHQAYGRKGLVCRKKSCGGIIERVKIGGRSAHFCSKHQKNIL